MPQATVHLVVSHPHHVREAQPRMRRLYVSDEDSLHLRVALAENLVGTLDGHLTHQDDGEGLELLGEMLAKPFSGRDHTVHRAVFATAPSRPGTHGDTLLVEEVHLGSSLLSVGQ